MKCPIDDVDLVIAERQGIEIDYCPKCRGIWLDRGELDKIIERAEPQPSRIDRGEGRDRYDDRDERRPYRKKKSILSEIFDF